MTRVSLSRELGDQGLGKPELARLVRTGQLTRVRRGAYAEPLPQDADRSAAHRDLLVATLRQVSAEAVASHASAALIHGLPVWNDQLQRVHLTRDRSGGGKRRHNMQVHGVPIGEDETATVDGIPVTRLARTVLDLACSCGLDRAVCFGDAAMRLGMTATELDAAVDRARRRHGIVRARSAAALLDGRSESPGESVSRVIFWRWGVPVPVLQLAVYGPDGILVGRPDFGWPELGTLGEFDGRSKYAKLLRPDQRPEDVVFAEKVREDALRDLGWQVVRWTWADLNQPAELVARLNRAFDRGRRTASPDRVRIL